MPPVEGRMVLGEPRGRKKSRDRAAIPGDFRQIQRLRRQICVAEKEALLLELCQCFHPYLMKYLVMICRGHVPIVGIGPKSSFGNVNSDVKKFLYYFLPKGQTLTRQNLNPVVRHLHLAFKEMGTEERYDVLMEQMVRAINQYDPDRKSVV